MFVSSITFLKLPFWIQVWGLLFDLINEEAGRDIGRSIGELVEVNYKAFNSDQARFLRIRLEVPLDKPLRQGGPVISSEGEMSQVAFKYKQLVGWCFSYGQISHDHKDCPSPVDAEEGGRPYGEWLKAGIRGRSVEAKGTQHHETRTQQTSRTKPHNTISPPKTDTPSKPDTEMPMEPNTDISPINERVNANPISLQPQPRNFLPQSYPMMSMHVSTVSSQLATTNAAVTNPLKSNTINTQPHNATLTQPHLTAKTFHSQTNQI